MSSGLCSGKVDPNWVVKRAERYLEAGADMIMIDSNGLMSSLDNLRSDLVAKIIERLGVEKIMFEANDPTVSEWFIKNYGPKVSCSSLTCIHVCFIITWSVPIYSSLIHASKLLQILHILLLLLVISRNRFAILGSTTKFLSLFSVLVIFQDDRTICVVDMKGDLYWLSRFAFLSISTN